MSRSATIPAPWSLPSGGGLLALIELAVSFLKRERLTAEEQGFLARIQTISEKYGAYVLGAEDRADLENRVDAVLEDAQFHEDFQSLIPPLDSVFVFEFAQELQDKLGQAPEDMELAQHLGPAAVPALRRYELYLRELARCLDPLFKGVTPALDVPASFMVPETPLAFLSDPDVPVPVARALLAGLRTHPLALAIGAVRFSAKPTERWLGLALAEMFAREARCTLALLAAVTGTDVPASILPPEDKLDLQALQQSTESVLKAYARFNTAAERSGEPVYPSAS